MAYPSTLDSFTTKVDHVDIYQASHINALQTSIVNTQAVLGYGSTQPTELATPNAIIKRDSNGVAYASRYGVLARNSTNQSIGSGGSYKTVDFASVEWQNGTLWTIANPTRLYAPVTGLYLVNAVITFASNSTGLRSVAFRQSGSTFVGANVAGAVNGADQSVNLTKILQLSASAYIEVMVYHTAGVSIDVIFQAGLSARAEMILL